MEIQGRLQASHKSKAQLKIGMKPFNLSGL